ncbi:DUF6090 family protein [Psychroserpens mesophilus]|uniref:DUF6090 family protein n=1 Tax=Psychroserpens mesophilus TaxID=325473 RepID=UPI003D661162
MIKFFRRIRQNFISEGKTAKYVKYAIGEIVLVVIGILIALQINNWNEARKTNNQLHGYLKSISKNIQSDTAEINQIKNIRIQHNHAAKDYMKCMIKDSMSLSLVSRIAPVVGEQYLNVNSAGFDALKNSGFIANLQGSAIEDAIFDYYAYFEEIHESETSLNNFIESMEVGLFDGDYDKISRFFKMRYKEMTNEELQLTLGLIYKNSKMLGIMQRVADEEYFEVYDSLKVKGHKIVKLIEAEIAND